MVLLAAGLVAGLVFGLIAGWCLYAALQLPLDEHAFRGDERQRVDFEWARMLENHMVGPTQTKHPRRS